MNDEQAFIAAIVAKPEDDAPRLVFADWLDEHAGEVQEQGPHDFPGTHSPEFYTSDCAYGCGSWMGSSRSGGAADPFGKCPNNTRHTSNGLAERSEFIRSQLELARTECEHERKRNIVANCSCRWCELKQRARELSRHGYPERGWIWAGEPLQGFNDAKWDYRRGFIELITCTAEEWLAESVAVLRAHPIREVRLTTWPDTKDLFRLNHGESPGNVIAHHEAILGRRWPGVKFTLPDPHRIDPRRFADRGPVLLDPRTFIHRTV